VGEFSFQIKWWLAKFGGCVLLSSHVVIRRLRPKTPAYFQPPIWNLAPLKVSHPPGKGNQDGKMVYDNLILEATLNVDADAEAG
jgi:hypothetical protein